MTVAVANMPTVRKVRRESTEVSSCLKYMIFGFNVLFWLMGLSILTVGVWAWSEKDIFNNLGKVANVALDPAFILICVGTVTFVIGFTGCVGALRENTCLLATYAIFLSVLLLFEVTAATLVFVFKDWIKSQATIGFQTFIIHYREDPDQQNLIDWIQEDWLQCCGIEGPKDWDRNNYFNCSSKVVGSREACGVPFSCCKRKPNEIIKNKQCGYDVRKPGFAFDVSKIIYEQGCLEAVEEWTEKNMISLASYGFLLLFFQILGICFAQNLRADIFAQKAKWH
ncbi:tetraspanin-5-like isoform X1 [Dendroctonus ponderosae]|uniref:Tetraspanin n=1 Tax=Dendroctonus ponderosae TaxID=77166 RepID=A0AAR5PUT9_DENPD|nr:tetraspanin-5 isoform X1 [Dendroctonus ponderosae]XP_019764781.1 tetraspanin-5 isoform X1 [Dendroctonus ponderosae]XP_048524375.1 tetraspanin-5-like isoform X1 [Dendroctonus ponderosae]XP_048524376.1 tetraspanin-5-like isoform X1 [Dendroctonus ponderosae]